MASRGSSCPALHGPGCDSCDPGYYLQGDSCLPNQCICPNGNASNGTGLGNRNIGTSRPVWLAAHSKFQTVVNGTNLLARLQSWRHSVTWKERWDTASEILAWCFLVASVLLAFRFCADTKKTEDLWGRALLAMPDSSCLTGCASQLVIGGRRVCDMVCVWFNILDQQFVLFRSF